jgi:hypothetical protein
LFLDPTNGIPSIYPYLYALVGSIPVKLLGAEPATSLKWLGLLAFCLFVFSVYLAGKTIKNHYTAILLVCLSLIMQSFPSKMIDLFLPVPFQLGLAFMALALYFCLKSKKKYSFRLLLLSGITCGIGIGIWTTFIFILPVFLLLIRDWKERLLYCLFSLTIVGIVCLPQYIYIYNSGYLHPYKQAGKISDLLKMPFVGDTPTSLIDFICCTLYLFAALAMKNNRQNREYLWPSAIGLAIVGILYLLFAPVYGARVQRLVNILWLLPLAHYLITLKGWRIMPGIGLLVIGLYYVGQSEHGMISRAHAEKSHAQSNRPIVSKLNELVPDKEFIFCTLATYHEIILGNTLKYGIAAHPNDKYYSMDKTVTERMFRDFFIAWSTNSEDTLKNIFKKYNIYYFLLNTQEGFSNKEKAIYKVSERAPVAFRSADNKFIILRIREADKSGLKQNSSAILPYKTERI